MGDDLLPILTRFHREIVLPDMKRLVENAIESRTAARFDDINRHFDETYRRFDRLETVGTRHAVPLHRGRV
jgi:hypothetical protein